MIAERLGIDPNSNSFKVSLISSIKEKISSKSDLSIPSLDISVGLPVDLPEESDPSFLANSFETAAEDPNSPINKLLMPSIGGIIGLLNSVPTPPIHLLASFGVPADPTSLLLPISNVLADIFASIGITNPNEFFLTNLGKITEKANALKNRINELVNAAADQISSKAERVAELLNEIDINLSVDLLKSKLIEKVDIIRERLLQAVPEVSLPTISEIQDNVLSFLGIELPEIPGVNIQDVLGLLTNFSLDIPGFGEFFLEIIKIKLQMLAQLALGIPPFLSSAVQEIASLLALGDFTGIIKAIAESVFGYFFEQFSSERIISLLEKAPSLVYTTHAAIQAIIGSFIPVVISLLLGEGLIAKGAAVSLGILK